MTIDAEQLCIRPFVETDRPAAGLVLAHAFPDKMDAMLNGNADAAPAILAALIDPKNTWVAALDHRVAGVATAQDPRLPEPSCRVWPLLRRHLAPLAAVRARLHLWLIHTVSVDADCLYLDTIAVEPDLQGDGVGRRLMDRVLDEARGRGKTRVGLYVIARNQRARALYERLGFIALHIEHLRLFASVTSFRDTIYMERELEQTDVDGDAPRVLAGERPTEPTGDRRRGLRARLQRVGQTVFERLFWRRGAAAG